jgi:hypothetical protein
MSNAEQRERDLEGRGLERLAEVARRITADEADAASHARGRDRFERALERNDRAALPVATRWPWLAGAAAIAVAAALLFVFWPARLDYAVEGTAVHEGYVHAERASRARFSDGTEIDFTPGARARISEVTSHGARVNVEEGQVGFHVAHVPRAAWTAAAGPFSIRVTGTDFDTTWIAERFELDLRAGAVSVRGPLINGELALRCGQRLVVDLGRNTFSVDDLASAARADVKPDAVVEPQVSSLPSSSATVEAPREAASSIARDVSSSRPASWRELVARGDFARVLAEADARGALSAIADSPLGELAALADAARYAGKSDLARRALVAERERFPGSAEARSAAFLIGRLDEGGAPSSAVGWYDRYLAESPSGPLAGEALGRKMITLKRTSGADAARPVADDYLHRYPGGPFAAAAEEIATAR